MFMSKLGNAISMLNLLSTGKKYSVSELASILEVSERMVRLYKEDFEKAGIYIDTIYGPTGGYVLNQTVKLPERRFSSSDYKFLLNLDLKDDDRERVQEIANKIRDIYIAAKIEKKDIFDGEKDTYNKLSRAIKESKKVKIKYYTSGKGESERIIHPLDLFYTSSSWAVAAYCELRGDLRHFELKRISSIEIMPEYFN